MARVCIIGLDCLTPELAFQPELMPALAALRRRGVSGPLESCVPPITVPAWSVMVTGRDPGSLGIYGFRDRRDRSYEGRRLASSLDVRLPTIWSLAGRAGLGSRLIGVPQTFPPKPVRGCLVSDAPTPGSGAPFTHPKELEAEVQALCGGYVADVPGHRQLPRDQLLAAVHEMTKKRFRLARAWLKEPDWQLFMMVEMGPDRMHHAFWRYQATDHPGYEPGHRFASAIRDYYVALDRELQSLLELLEDDDVVLVVSDHGAKSMQGGVALNQWLVEQGDLVLRRAPSSPTAFDALEIDWPRTRAWADGGYVGRVYLNVRDREPEGVVGDVETYLHDLTTRLEALKPGSRAVRPRDIYNEVQGVAPDLIVHLGDLAYRALGSVGHPSVFVPDNDTGPDDANHAQHGVFVMRDGRGFRETGPLSIYDVAPTVLDRLGLAAPAGLRGRVL